MYFVILQVFVTNWHCLMNRRILVPFSNVSSILSYFVDNPNTVMFKNLAFADISLYGLTQVGAKRSKGKV